LKSKLHTQEELDRAHFELELLTRLKHPNIIPCLGGEETPESIIIVTPLAKGDLHSFTVNKVLSEDNCRRLSKQLLEGLCYLHSLGYLHGDVKPENVLIFPSITSPNLNTIKICDFGFAEQVGPSGLLPYRGMRGSYGYFSPEQLNRRPYGQAVDIFALGIMIYTSLSGYEPFYPTNKAGLLTGDPTSDSQILVFDSPYWDMLKRPEVFLRGVLHGDPCKRLTAQEALDSDWIRSNPSAMPSADLSASPEDADIQFE
jgi:serine/threonine protein kinase